MLSRFYVLGKENKRGEGWRNHFLDEQPAPEIQAQLAHQIPLLNNRPVTGLAQVWWRWSGLGPCLSPSLFTSAATVASWEQLFPEKE